MLLISNYLAVTHFKSISFSNNTPNFFEKFEAVGVLNGSSG